MGAHIAGNNAKSPSASSLRLTVESTPDRPPPRTSDGRRAKPATQVAGFTWAAENTPRVPLWTALTTRSTPDRPPATPQSVN